MPFCVRKCAYCDFLSMPADESVQEAYIDRLDRELRRTAEQMAQDGTAISTIYFGGGTPSVLPGRQIIRLMDTLRRFGMIRPDAEITLEMNPGTVTSEKMDCYRAAGINRLSIGCQSFQEEELKLLGRIHTCKDFMKTYEMARRAGFANISIDLMSGLPGQTAESWRRNLDTAVSLGPEHISAYSLIIEEGTPFYDRYGSCWSEENEELDRQMYEDTKAILEKAGYLRYEISNYARPGYESRHNSSYWTGIPYYGCGLGASSLVKRPDGWFRTRNESSLKRYLEENTVVPEEEERLTERDRMEEFMFLGLRLTRGICISEFEHRFSRSFAEVYGDAVRELKKDGLMGQEDDRLFLTDRGLDLSNYCFEKFLE
ncbi:MAG: radical SAM family heme chaperone HemW [Lachnospiraceae bacterium]